MSATLEAIDILQFSETFGALAEAMAAAQLAFEPYKADNTARIEKDGVQKYTYKYADLGGLIEATRPHLNRNGIAVFQGSTTIGRQVCTETRLVHGKSGEWVRNVLALPATEEVKSIGSAVTYGRRYSLQSLLGVAPSDDDGRAASDAGAIALQEAVDVARAQAEKIAAEARAALDEQPRKLHEAREAIRTLIDGKTIAPDTVARLLSEMTDGKQTTWQAMTLGDLRGFWKVLNAWKPESGPGSALDAATAEFIAGAESASPAPKESPESAVLDETPAPPDDILAGAAMVEPKRLPDEIVAPIEKYIAENQVREDVLQEIAAQVSFARGMVSTYEWRDLATRENARAFASALKSKVKEMLEEVPL